MGLIMYKIVLSSLSYADRIRRRIINVAVIW